MMTQCEALAAEPDKRAGERDSRSRGLAMVDFARVAAEAVSGTLRRVAEVWLNVRHTRCVAMCV